MNKSKLRNDMILTLSLILSMVFIRIFMIISNVKFHETPTGNIAFLVLAFLTIKVLYISMSKVADKLEQRKKVK